MKRKEIYRRIELNLDMPGGEYDYGYSSFEGKPRSIGEAIAVLHGKIYKSLMPPHRPPDDMWRILEAAYSAVMLFGGRKRGTIGFFKPNKPPVYGNFTKGEITESEVRKIIDSERNYQDVKWPKHQHDYGSFLVMLKVYVDKAATVWTGTAGEDGDILALDEIRKVAALAVAFLEQR